MNSFQECNRLGALGEALVEYGLSKVFRQVDGVPKNIESQLRDSDLISRGFEPLLIPDLRYEVKTEWSHTGNLFWETFSNKSAGRLGWGLTSSADVLYYLFWEQGIGYRIDDLQRKIWAFDYAKNTYREVKQKRYEQSNDTWGCLIPVQTDWLGAVKFDFQRAKPSIESRQAIAA